MGYWCRLVGIFVGGVASIGAQHESIGCAPLQPYTAVSADGAYKLEVEPRSREGVGPALTTLTKGGKRVWSRELPFSLRRAVVSTQGVVAGQAYIKDQPRPITEVDRLLCRVIDPAGAVRYRWQRDRQCGAPGTPNWPLGAGTILMEGQDRVLFRIKALEEIRPQHRVHAEAWLAVSLATFRSLGLVGTQPTGQEGSHGLVDVRPIPGRALLLASRRGLTAGGISGRFVLFDLNARPLWSSGGIEKKGTIKRWTGGRWLLLTEKDFDQSRLLVLSDKGAVIGELSTRVPEAKKIATWPDGSFAVLSGNERIRRFDAKGKPLWSNTTSMSPEDIDTSSDGRVAVLCNIGSAIDVYAGDGTRLKTLEFHAADDPMEQKPVSEEAGAMNYPTMLVVDKDGCFRVKNSAGRHTIHRYGPDGNWLGTWYARAENGRRIGFINDMNTDPYGRVWIAEGPLCRLDADGRVDKVLGGRSPKGVLRQVSHLRTDRQGNPVCFDQVNHVVATYDRKGVRKAWFRLAPQKEEMLEGEWGEDVFVGPGGLLNLSTGEKAFLQYDLTGRRRGSLKGRSARGWMADRDVVLRLDKAGQVLQRIRKGTGGRWLGLVTRLQVDHRGQLLVGELHGTELSLWSQVSLFNSAGKPMGRIPYGRKWKKCSDPCLCGRFVYMLDYGTDRIRVCDHAGQQVALYPGPTHRPPGFRGLTQLWADGRSGVLWVLGEDRLFGLDLHREKDGE